MTLSAGDKLGPYEICSRAGVGGMGEVYKARDTRLDRIVAIKKANEKFTERFEREARAIAALNHPNIYQLFFSAITQKASSAITSCTAGTAATSCKESLRY